MIYFDYLKATKDLFWDLLYTLSIKKTEIRRGPSIHLLLTKQNTRIYESVWKRIHANRVKNHLIKLNLMFHLHKAFTSKKQTKLINGEKQTTLKLQ